MHKRNDITPKSNLVQQWIVNVIRRIQPNHGAERRPRPERAGTQFVHGAGLLGPQRILWNASGQSGGLSCARRRPGIDLACTGERDVCLNTIGDRYDRSLIPQIIILANIGLSCVKIWT